MIVIDVHSTSHSLLGLDKVFVLSWEQRFKICVGIARGLAYLHEELQPKMIHRSDNSGRDSYLYARNH